MELSHANKSLERMSLHDGLTDVPNRRFFDVYLAGQMGVARRYPQRPLSLLLFDIDHFKAYNDRHGHIAGDECLKKIATALHSCCRRPADMAARYGGEEFALILPDTDLVGATNVAEHARLAVSNLRIPHTHGPASQFVTVSGGVAMFWPRADTSAHELINAADMALFQAKALGRNRIASNQNTH
jgi:diguanylate cyclase (GGDEF)-like protein